ncbi:MFS transporter [Thermaerobacter litoralis]
MSPARSGDSGRVPPARRAPGGPVARSLWRHRPFVVLWLARIVSVAGGMASMVAVQWWVLQATGSAQWMATTNAAVTLVMALVGLPAGVLVDRVHRGRFFLALELGRGAVMAALAALLLGGHATLPAVMALLALDAAGLALFMPLNSAIWPELVPAHQLAAANGLVATGESVGRIVGPAVGGLLATRHPGWAALTDAVSYAVSALALVAAGALGWAAPGSPAGAAGRTPRAGIQAESGGPGTAPAGTAAEAAGEAPKPAAGRRAGFAVQFRQGMAAVVGRPDLGPFFLLVSALNLAFSMAFVLIPVVVEEVLQGGPQTLGWVQAAFALGAIAGGLWAGSGRIPRRATAWFRMLSVQALLGAALGSSRWLLLSLAVAWTFGLLNALVNVAVSTLLQESVEPGLRGRVFGLLFTVAMILQPLGQMTGGILADRMPVAWVFAISSLLVVTSLVVAWWRAPSLRSFLDRLPAPAAVAAPGTGPGTGGDGLPAGGGPAPSPAPAPPGREVNP